MTRNRHNLYTGRPTYSLWPPFRPLVPCFGQCGCTKRPEEEPCRSGVHQIPEVMSHPVHGSTLNGTTKTVAWSKFSLSALEHPTLQAAPPPAKRRAATHIYFATTGMFPCAPIFPICQEESTGVCAAQAARPQTREEISDVQVQGRSSHGTCGATQQVNTRRLESTKAPCSFTVRWGRGPSFSPAPHLSGPPLP